MIRGEPVANTTELDALQREPERALNPEDVLVLRCGPGANCSSVGSVLDLLFLSAVAGGVLLVGVTAALDRKRDDGREAREKEPAKDDADRAR
jgi:hypothetical protein